VNEFSLRRQRHVGAVAFLPRSSSFDSYCRYLLARESTISTSSALVYAPYDNGIVLLCCPKLVRVPGTFPAFSVTKDSLFSSGRGRLPPKLEILSGETSLQFAPKHLPIGVFRQFRPDGNP
jgi:hypothetical protein